MRLTGAALKRFAKRSIRQLGIDIRRAGAAGGTPDLADFLAARQVDVVLDVGANRGQFGQWLRDHGYRDAIVSFEPIGSVFSDLNAAAERDGNWQAHRLAIGSAAGRALLNVSRTTEYSSILGQSAEAQRFDTEAAGFARKRSRSRA